MSKLRRLLYLCFIGYVAFSVYLFNGYSQINDKLDKVNDTLLATCTFTKNEAQQLESERY